MDSWSPVWIEEDAAITDGIARDVTGLFRRELTDIPDVSTLRIRCSASMEYRLWVDDAFVGFGPAISDSRHPYFDTHECPVDTTLTHVVALEVYHPGAPLEDFHGLPPFVACTVELINKDRNTIATVETDDQWQACIAPHRMRESRRQSFQLGMLEHVDLRKEPIGWRTRTFDATDWPHPCFLESLNELGYGEPVESTLPPIGESERTDPDLIVAGVVKSQESTADGVTTFAEIVQKEAWVRELSPDQVTTNRPYVVHAEEGETIALVFDLGAMSIGSPFIDIESEQDGVIVDVSISEYLRDRRVIAKRWITPGAYTALSDRIILRAGRQYWQRRDYNGYRFIQLTIRNATKPLRINTIGSMERIYPFQPASFVSSDPELDRLFTISCETHRTAVHWGYCGSTWREHAQWNDLPWVYNNCAVFSDSSLLDYFFEQNTLSQTEEGKMLCPYPGAQAIELPEQTMWLAEELVWRRRYFGQWDGESRVLARLQKSIAWFRSHTGNDALLDVTSDWDRFWLVFDWGYPYATQHHKEFIPGLDRSRDQSTHGGAHAPGVVATLNILWWHYQRLVAKLLGDSKLHTQADKTRAAIYDRFWNEESGFFGETDALRPSAFACAEAIRTGLIEPENTERVWSYAVGADGRVGRSSPWYTSSFLEGYAAAGKIELGIAAIKRLWGSMARRGATTFWEQWDCHKPDVHPLPGYTPEMWAQTIAYASGPGPFLIRHVAGIQPVSEGFTAARVHPRTDLLQHAHVTVPTVHGEFRVRWLQDWTTKATELYLTCPVPTQLQLVSGTTLELAPGIHSMILDPA